jgi:hypothetical protein
MNLTQVVGQLRAERDRLDKAISALSGLNGDVQPKRRTLSKAARERIAAAQRARWAKVKRKA